jgi:hypothetical protein
MPDQKEKVYCGRCPFVEVCYGTAGDGYPAANATMPAKDCKVAQLLNGQAYATVKANAYIEFERS